jgi:hypothetical protein
VTVSVHETVKSRLQTALFRSTAQLCRIKSLLLFQQTFSVLIFWDLPCHVSLVTTSWGRVILENLIVRWTVVKKFLVFCGNRRFITVCTRARHWIISGARLIQSRVPDVTCVKLIYSTFACAVWCISSRCPEQNWHDWLHVVTMQQPVCVHRTVQWT